MLENIQINGIDVYYTTNIALRRFAVIMILLLWLFLTVNNSRGPQGPHVRSVGWELMCVLKKHVLVKNYSKIPHSRFGGEGNAIYIKYLVRCCVSEFFPRFILAESFLMYANALDVCKLLILSEKGKQTAWYLALLVSISAQKWLHLHNSTVLSVQESTHKNWKIVLS